MRTGSTREAMTISMPANALIASWVAWKSTLLLLVAAVDMTMGGSSWGMAMSCANMAKKPMPRARNKKIPKKTAFLSWYLNKN